VRKSGNEVRITAQLIQVKDGFHLWSESYDRKLDNVFAIQDEIATAILKEMKATLLKDEAKAITATRTDSKAYDLYLLARQRMYERTRLTIESAAQLLDQAIAEDPSYAPAYAQRGIAALLLSERSYGEMSRAEANTQGRLYLDKALQLDPQLAEAWAGMGLYHSDRPGEYPQAIDALQKSLAINPNLIDASNWLQIAYGATGENVKALHILEDMVQRDPLYPPGFGNAVQSYNLFGQQEKSWALLQKIRPFLPNNPAELQAEGITWLSLGQPAKAMPLLEAALKQQPSDAVIRAWFSACLAQTGQFEQLAEHGDPRFKPFALTLLNRPEEALEIARKLAGEGNPGQLIAVLNLTGQQKQLVDFVESRWPDLAAFERENPDDGTGYGAMLNIARAYAAMGNEARFNDAMARVRAAHDRSIEQGIAGKFYLADEARYYLLSGDRQKAVKSLAQAVDDGLVVSAPFTRIWPEMKVLAGDPRFEAIQARMFKRVNAARAELGLGPLTT
jgi:tetratricopeptide (TPR) repeat protein